MANLTWAHLGIKFPSGQQNHEELLWKSKFEIIANIVISSILGFLPAITHRGWPSCLCFPRGCAQEAEERNCLSMGTCCWMFARLDGGPPKTEVSAFILLASVQVVLDLEEESVALGKDMFEGCQVIFKFFLLRWLWIHSHPQWYVPCNCTRRPCTFLSTLLWVLEARLALFCLLFLFLNNFMET